MLEYNGGSSITSDQEANMSGNGEFPNQSTPKASLVEDPQQQQQQQQQSTEETKTEETKQIESVEVARGGSASFSEANVSVNLNSNTSKEEKVEPMQLMDTVDNKQTGFNVGDYFQSKQNKLEKPVQIVINLEQGIINTLTLIPTPIYVTNNVTNNKQIVNCSKSVQKKTTRIVKRLWKRSRNLTLKTTRSDIWRCITERQE